MLNTISSIELCIRITYSYINNKVKKTEIRKKIVESHEEWKFISHKAEMFPNSESSLQNLVWTSVPISLWNISTLKTDVNKMEPLCTSRLGLCGINKGLDVIQGGQILQHWRTLDIVNWKVPRLSIIYWLTLATQTPWIPW